MKKKLKDVSYADFVNFKKQCCVNTNCDVCLFSGCNCLFDKNCWVYHKNILTEEFLNQEIEVGGSILDNTEKNYLKSILKPFIKYGYEIKISKFYSLHENIGYHFLLIELRFGKMHERINLPYFLANEMYKGMKTNVSYSLEELELK